MNYFTTAIIILIIPSIIIFSKDFKLLKKVFLPTIFFAMIFFIYELVSLKIGSWWWPGEYLLPIKIFGKIFPLDDVIIWYFLSTITLIGGYEFFADDEK
jgi:Mn2+/Fe2+ NRAMP family transporter